MKLEASEYVVLLGTVQSETQFKTHGSGFLISRDNIAYVITCKHVGFDMSKFKIKFALHKPKKSTNISINLFLSDPIYYDISTDICIMKILKYNSQTLNAHGIYTINLDYSDNICECNPEDNLEVYGFPGNQTSLLLQKNNPEEMVPVHIVHCIATNWSVNSNLKLNESEFIDFNAMKVLLAKDDMSDIEGMSGGPIINTQSNKLCGILSAGKKNCIILNKPRPILLMLPGKYILDLLNKITTSR